MRFRLHTHDQAVFFSTAMLVIIATLMYVFSIKQVIAIACPLVIDINKNGKIDITGYTSTAQKVYTIPSLSKRILFDINADGTPDHIDWIKADTDAFLIDKSRLYTTSEPNGTWLFGNNLEEGFFSGFEKLSQLDANQDGILTGSELGTVALWQDNGDGLFDKIELRALDEFGITSIPINPLNKPNPYGAEASYQNALLADGQEMYMEDVWFMTEDEASPVDNAIAAMISSIL